MTTHPKSLPLAATAAREQCSIGLLRKRLNKRGVGIPGAWRNEYGNWLIPVTWRYKPGRRGNPNWKKNLSNYQKSVCIGLDKSK